MVLLLKQLRLLGHIASQTYPLVVAGPMALVRALASQLQGLILLWWLSVISHFLLLELLEDPVVVLIPRIAFVSRLHVGSPLLIQDGLLILELLLKRARWDELFGLGSNVLSVHLPWHHLPPLVG